MPKVPRNHHDKTSKTHFSPFVVVIGGDLLVLWRIVKTEPVEMVQGANYSSTTFGKAFEGTFQDFTRNI